MLSKTAWNLFKPWKILLLGVEESCSDIWSRSSSSSKTEALALQTGACNSLCTYGLLNYFYKSYRFTKLSDIAAEPYSERLDIIDFSLKSFSRNAEVLNCIFKKKISHFLLKYPGLFFICLPFKVSFQLNCKIYTAVNKNGNQTFWLGQNYLFNLFL